MRILFLVSPNEQGIIDRLIIGLARIGFALGEEMTVFPYKPVLHEVGDTFCSYQLPHFCYPPLAEDVAKQLRDGVYDVVFIGDALHWPSLRQMNEFIIDAIGDLPCVHIWDNGARLEDAWDYRLLNVIATFNRFSTKDSDDYPIGYGALRERMPCRPGGVKLHDTFFAGAQRNIRDEFLDVLRDSGYSNLFSSYLSGGYTSYRMALRHARASFVFMDNMYLLRRIEGGAQGVCLFLRQNKKLYIRNDYVDGESAVFFTTPTDLVEKLDDVLSTKGKAEQIGAAAFEHVLEYHLVEHVAGYVTGKVLALLP